MKKKPLMMLFAVMISFLLADWLLPPDGADPNHV